LITSIEHYGNEPHACRLRGSQLQTNSTGSCSVFQATATEYFFSFCTEY